MTVDGASKKQFTLKSGILRFQGKIYIGSSTKLRDTVFDTFHSSAFGGHSGVKATLHRIQQSFYWPKLKNYVTEKVAMCPICQISKTERLPYPGLFCRFQGKNGLTSAWISSQACLNPKVKTRY
jgi:hypothetical protein